MPDILETGDVKPVPAYQVSEYITWRPSMYGLQEFGFRQILDACFESVYSLFQLLGLRVGLDCDVLLSKR